MQSLRQLDQAVTVSEFSDPVLQAYARTVSPVAAIAVWAFVAGRTFSASVCLCGDQPAPASMVIRSAA